MEKQATIADNIPMKRMFITPLIHHMLINFAFVRREISERFKERIDSGEFLM
jgi:hypothetical protein